MTSAKQFFVEVFIFLMALLPLFIRIGLIFGFLAALFAYLITYKEYSRHYTDPHTPRMLALRTGIFTYLFFMAIALMLSFVFPALSI